MGSVGGDPEYSFAIPLALNSPEVEVLGITTVQGNVPVERSYSNAACLRHWALPSLLAWAGSEQRG